MLYLDFSPSMLTEQYIQELEDARNDLDPYARLPEEYTVELRRHALVETIHYSTRIEGNTLTLEQVQSLLAGENIRAPQAQVQEVQNYREALSYIHSLGEGSARITEETIRTIHYLVTKSLTSDYSPGHYRTVQNYVVDSVADRRVFLPPAPENVPGLMQEFVEWLNQRNELPATFRAALAHLNLVAIHPFSDGNGRTARVLDSLVLYREGFRSQYLVSLEAHFGRDTQSYYRALAAALGPRYAPPKDTTPWVEYYLRAHVEEALAALQYTKVVVEEFDGLKEAFRSERLSAWQVSILLYAYRSGRISNRVYRQITGRSHQSAVIDFSKLMTKGLLQRLGLRRSVVYVPSERTKDVFRQIHLQLEQSEVRGADKDITSQKS